MARTYFSNATHAIIGYHPTMGNGILFWHDCELDAYRDAKEINKTPDAYCRVVPSPGGKLNEINQKEVYGYIFED